jgi:hypothetical protein
MSEVAGRIGYAVAITALATTLAYGVSVALVPGPPPTTTTTTTTLAPDEEFLRCVDAGVADLMVDVQGMTVPTAITIAEDMCGHWMEGP